MFRKLSLAVSFTAFAALAVLPARASEFYICTGLGYDARQEAKAFRHTMHLVFAGSGGAYLGEVAVRIESGKDVIVEIGCDGPWFMINLVPGDYTVTATHKGVTRRAVVKVGERRVKKVLQF